MTTHHDDNEESSMSKKAARQVSEVLVAVEEEEGLGAIVRRAIGSPEVREFTLRWPYCLTIIGCNFVFDDLLREAWHSG